MAKKRIELNRSEVVFIPEDHTYWLGDKQLSGITSLIDRQLYPNTYDNVPDEILSQAADYGHAVHESIEAFDSLWQNDGTQELADYIQLCTSNGLVHEASEYLISDNASYASMIDKVYRVDETTFDLADIKTYGVINDEKLQKTRWQLSLYAALFELQNPKAKVRNLYVLHIRNKQKKDDSFDHIADIIPVERILSDICFALMEADSKGEQFNNPFGIPDDIRAKEQLIRQLIQTKQEAEQKLADIKASILSTMEAQGITTWFTDTMRLTRKLPTTRSSFNLNLFKEKNPDLDTAPYMRVSQVAGSLTITI